MPSNTSGVDLVGAPPIPREPHVWLAFWAPVAIAWCWLRPAPAPAVLFLGTALCAFLAAEAARSAQGRAVSGDPRWWLALELVGVALGGCSLVMAFQGRALLLVAAAAAGLIGLSSATRAADAGTCRTMAGKQARAWVLSLSGPAACVVACGRIESHAWLLCAASITLLSSFPARQP